MIRDIKPVVDSEIMISTDDFFREKIIHALNDMDIDLTGYRFVEEDKHLYTQLIAYRGIFVSHSSTR